MAANKRFVGEGIIILLCGPPGVGKTLTAEAGKSKQLSSTSNSIPRFF